MPLIDWDVKQGSIGWHLLRAGIPTASEFHHIITPKQGKLSESRKPYQCRLLAERLLNWQADSLDKIGHIEDGKINEPFAVAQLEEIREIETTRVGFIRTDDGRFGASPDRVTGISADRRHVGTVIEAKAPTIPKQFEYLFFGHEDAYRCQVQGQLYVAEADKALFYAYNPRTPAYLFETGRDEDFIRKLRDALNQFSDELEDMTERARHLGAFQAFPRLMLPVEAEHDAERFRPPTDAEIQNLIDGPLGEFG
jgi:hypothetical protein